ncbi:hypothetical protein [Flavobacterium luteolum]|uniref:hypothetical protein n=1 Tax=Flavobacterium luteolum TaxID=3003259 RepID=UPI00248E07DA|nr:hypothetical protein [Flavobacterium luteolum]
MIRQTKSYHITRYFLAKLVFFLCLSNGITAQSVDEMPWDNKKYLTGTSIKFKAPDKDFYREQAGREYQVLRLKYEKSKSRLQSQANSIKIGTESAVEFINLVPAAPIITSPLKEWIYQDLDNFKSNKEENFAKKFNNAILDSFEANTKKTLQTDNGLTFDASLDDFKNEIQVFKNSLKMEDYQIIAPKVDEVILGFIKNNRKEYEDRFNSLKNENQAQWKNLESDIGSKLKDLESKTIEFDRLVLEKVKENAVALQKYSEGVTQKFQQQQSDIDAMRKEIKENGEKIESNKAEIEKITGKIGKIESDIQKLNQLAFENKQLISENTFKIDVIADVLYDNVNTSGKMKLLDLRYKNDQSNSSYQKEKQRLENIQTIEDIKYQLATGREVLTLASNLGLSDKDYKEASKILAVGEVIAGGAMAYYTGNPVAGLQAVNGAFALFGGGPKPNPEFDAIMQQFAIVNKKLDQINDKLDALSKNLTEFRNLTIDLHQENQKRFDIIEEKLDKIQTDVNNMTGLIYAQTTEGLKQENITGYGFLWTDLQKATKISTLKQLYNGNQKLKNTVDITYNNTENKSIDSKPFLHFNNYDKESYWEYKIYTPMLEMASNIYGDGNLKKFENSITYIYDFSEMLKLKENAPANYSKDIFPEIKWDIKKLIYPQALITLTNFTSLFEPYFYFSSSSISNNYSIPAESVLKDINYANKNKSLKIQFENILKENRTAILQTNIIAGIPIISYVRKHIEEPSFNVFEKKKIYEIISSENYYVKANLSNSILYGYIHQQNLHAEKLNKLLSCDCKNDEYDALLKDFNRDFANGRYELGRTDSQGANSIALFIKPTNIPGIDLSTKPIILPLPPFEYVYENRIMYPSYLELLYENMAQVVNKVVKYDIVEKMNENNFINLKLLK